MQLVIWLDLSFLRTVFRVKKRAADRSLMQEELWPGTGNRESFRRAFRSKESIIWWSINQYRKKTKAVQCRHFLSEILTYFFSAIRLRKASRFLFGGLAKRRERSHDWWSRADAAK